MSNDLGLGGDGDEIDLVEDVEAAFGVTLKNSELEQMFNVGQLYDALLTRIGEKNQRPNLCFSALVFYRLRRALMPFAGGERIGPKFLIKSEFRAERTDKIVDHLEKEAGLTLPGLNMGAPQVFGFLLVLSAFLLPMAAQELADWPPLVGFFVIPVVLLMGIKLVKLRRGKMFSADYVDLGTLARKVVALNYGKLVQEHGYSGDDDLWSALIAILKDHSEKPEATINRDTKFVEASMFAFS